jgi:4-alpha-glucanotransferase
MHNLVVLLGTTDAASVMQWYQCSCQELKKNIQLLISQRDQVRHQLSCSPILVIFGRFEVAPFQMYLTEVNRRERDVNLSEHVVFGESIEIIECEKQSLSSDFVIVH